MSCCDLHALSRYVDGELSLNEYRRVAEHVRSCESCRQEIATLRHMNRTLHTWGARRQPMSASAEVRVARTIARRRKIGPLVQLARMTPAAVGSSIAAVLMLLTVNVGPLHQNASPTPQPRPTMAQRTIKQQSRPLQYARSRSAVISSKVDVPVIRLPRHYAQLDIY